jgi:predicted peptidase
MYIVMKYQVETSFTKEIRYLLYKPKEYTGDNPFPLMIFLHGAGERGDDLEIIKLHGPPNLIDQGGEFPFIIASPQVAEGEWWSPSTVIWVLQDVKSKLNVDSKRVYLTGLSMGGYGTWEIAIKHPQLFAAIAPICGGGIPGSAERIKHIPTWVFHGVKDTIVPIERSEEMYEALKQFGNIEFTVYPEADHDSWTETYENTKLYEWLLSRARGLPRNTLNQKKEKPGVCNAMNMWRFHHPKSLYGKSHVHNVVERE